METFEKILTEEEIKDIQEQDNIFNDNIISLNDKKNLKFLNSYAYQQYLKKKNNFNGGVSNE